MDTGEIVNKVANSGLISLDLEELYDHRERVIYDLKDNLFQEMILREKDFRAFLKEHDWSAYQDKNVAVTCSVDAIIPTWAYMLLALHLQPYAHQITFGTLEEMETQLFNQALEKVNVEEYRDKKVVVKGCSKFPVPTSAYLAVTVKLKPVVQSLMFGEPCSTVPLYKRPKA